MAAIHGRYGSGSHFFYASEYVCLLLTQQVVFSLFPPSTNLSAHPRSRLFTYTGYWYLGSLPLRDR